MASGNTDWAVVTGASSGLGSEFATALAARGTRLVLVARREEPMRELAATLTARHGVEIVVEALDLGEASAPAALRERLDRRGIDPAILINNAAFGLSAPFLEHDPERLRAMLQLDVVATTELTYFFGKRMAARGRGRILLVASLAGHQPTPRLAAYGAAKAYLVSLGEALHVELAPSVGVTVLSPGLMDTGFNAVAGYEPNASLSGAKLAPARVAAIGLEALFADRPSVIAGGLNRAMAFSNRFLSRHVAARMVLRMSGG